MPGVFKKIFDQVSLHWLQQAAGQQLCHLAGVDHLSYLQLYWTDIKVFDFTEHLTFTE